ncbi:MAG TPA: response regulator [Candidatus Polarisedimenticolaceae bacterium]|nr:response regulator [Candidatus Polarisedimenticolaceae bacterium]
MAGDARAMPRRILVVDDDPEIRSLTRLVLEGEGYLVDEAEDGEAAVARALAGDLDLVLLDVNMPKMSGWETLRVLKTDPFLAALPVVMFTIKAEVRDKVHGLQDGALDYITKPFQVDELAARVRRIFQGVGA